MIGRLVVVGLGLIGGSFAKGLRESGLCGEVVGVDLDPQSRTLAVELGVVDRCEADLAVACQGADVIQLAVPILAMEKLLAVLAGMDLGQAILTDVGSAKGNVVRAARLAFGGMPPRFVPGHPIAGAEKSGVSAARGDLYQGRRVVLTPLPENLPTDVARIRAAWEACGARVSELAPEEHDRVFAAVSHLPHLLAFALVHDLAVRPNSDQLFGFAAGGFRDFTRIASSHPEMWRDICLANRAALLGELDAYMAELLRTRVLLAAGDSAGLETMFASARARRDAWLDGQKS